jgi:hypothetical protein
MNYEVINVAVNPLYIPPNDSCTVRPDNGCNSDFKSCPINNFNCPCGNNVEPTIIEID